MDASHFKTAIQIKKKNEEVCPPLSPENLHASAEESKSEEITVEKMTNSLFTKDQILKTYLTPKTSKMFSIRTIRVSLTDGMFRIKYQLFPVFDSDMLKHKKIVAINEFTANEARSSKKMDTQRQKIFIVQKKGGPMDWKDNERMFVLFSWVLIWCGCLKAQERKEKHFRLKQLIQVIL